MLESQEFDELDANILKVLQTNARISIADIATSLKVPHSTITLRLKRLEEKKIIKGYSVILDESKLGFDLIAVGTLKIKPGNGDFFESLNKYAGKFNLHSIYPLAGEPCAFFTMKCKNLADLQSKLEEIRNFEEVQEATASIATNELQTKNYF